MSSLDFLSWHTTCWKKKKNIIKYIKSYTGTKIYANFNVMVSVKLSFFFHQPAGSLLAIYCKRTRLDHKKVLCGPITFIIHPFRWIVLLISQDILNKSTSNCFFIFGKHNRVIDHSASSFLISNFNHNQLDIILSSLIQNKHVLIQ